MFGAQIYLVVVTSKETLFVLTLAFHRLGAKAEARGYLILPLPWAQSFLRLGKQTLHLDIEKLIEKQFSKLITNDKNNAQKEY